MGKELSALPRPGRSVNVRIPLRWRDMDVLGHLYAGRYHELLDEARAAVFTSVTGPLGFPFVLVRVELDHEREVRRADQALDVYSEVRAIGASSVRIFHRFTLAGGGVAASGASTLVAWDRDRRVGRPITPAERHMLSGADGPVTEEERTGAEHRRPSRQGAEAIHDR